MRGILALYRIIISYKELCKTRAVDLMYNEFIILIALSEKRNYVGRISRITLIDKGQVDRLLKSLIEKGVVEKVVEDSDPKYFLTEKGEEVISSLEGEIEDNNRAMFIKLRAPIIAYEKNFRNSPLITLIQRTEMTGERLHICTI